MNYWQKEMETMPRAKLKELQLERLKHIAAYCYENVPFYHKKFDDCGFSPYKIKTLKDIEYIPYTTKEDIRDNYPFGMFAVPKKKIVRLHASSGTTGKPTVVGYTRNDLDMWSDVVARLCVSVGVTRRRHPHKFLLATVYLPGLLGCTTAWKKSECQLFQLLAEIRKSK